MSEPRPISSRTPMVEVGRYRRLADARESSLALAALEMAYAIDRDRDEWVLRVEESEQETARREVALFERELSERPEPPMARTFEKTPTFSLYVAAWLLGGFFVAQTLRGPAWVGRGVADNSAILSQAEWWRVVTALTLHGDFGHLAANLAAGLLFAAFLLPQLGTGATWMSILLSGAVGNAINAWGYRGESHRSIGASTAVFGALGLLVGCELLARWRSPATRKGWQLVLPVGAGFALLAFLGAGEERERVDFMAHWWGFVVGLPLGALAAAAGVRERVPAWAQRGMALGTLGLVGLAWVAATRH